MSCGFQPKQVVWDGVVKEREHIAFAIKAGVYLNIDSFHELEQVAEIIGNTGAQTARAGLRVNPQVGDGSINCTSTASNTSKFGVLISDREEIIACFLRHKWLVGIHCHVGSHGCALDMLWAAATSIFELAEAINSTAARKAVRVLDVGGGISMSDGSDFKTRFREFFRQQVAVRPVENEQVHWLGEGLA